MRITDQMMTRRIVDELQRSAQRLERAQRRVATGLRLQVPSDDPQGVSELLRLKAAIASNEQYLRNVQAAQAWLSTTDASLGGLGEVLVRAQALAVQGANGTLDADQQYAVATEVDSLLGQAVQMANATFSGRYIFAGSKTASPPFTATGSPISSVTYNGNTVGLRWEIGPDQVLAVNITGDRVFTTVFSALIALRDSLIAGDTAAIRSSMSALETAHDVVLSVRAEVGATVNRLEMVKDHLDEVQLHFQELRSQVEDLDMAEGISELAVREAAHRAALGAAARVLQPSLLDYLT